jgi:excisionase family DNA binding protein
MTHTEQTYFTREEAAQYLRLSQRSIDYAREKGDLHAYQVGRKILFTRQALDTYVRRRIAGADCDVRVEEARNDESTNNK